MHPREWGLLDVCLRLTSGGKNPLYLDGRTMAARFRGVSKSSVYRSVKRLAKAGWLVEEKESERNKETQRFEKTVYRVLTHEQWTAKHGAKSCLSNGTGTSDSSPSNGTGASPSFATSQSLFCNEPVPKEGHNSVCNPKKESSVVCASSVPKEGLVSSGHAQGSGEDQARRESQPVMTSGLNPRPLTAAELAIRDEFQRTRRQRMLEGVQ